MTGDYDYKHKLKEDVDDDKYGQKPVTHAHTSRRVNPIVNYDGQNMGEVDDLRCYEASECRHTFSHHLGNT